ncbi:DUF2157 domain-containing protein [Ottowia testudinis]|uniref:DUF2157 domain-containing protein n=1 Tax=Ottowia testudinis TaxID=2816950 RepID=A0A975H590_9BURK|nr:DUF2157 domain-containing protein [Ottowia testudinis]QTD47131.1 DUF2157 domain-containing protein [Ottowia testudinis]
MHALIHQLAHRFALDGAGAERLWALSDLHRKPDQLGPYLYRSLAVLAALLLGAGLIFWVAANWQDQTREFKLHLLEGAVLVSALAALVLPRLRTACLLLATLALGGLLAFVGQTYQTGADAWQLFLAWAALALAWALAARRDGLWAVWILIVGLALALWSGDALLNPLQSLLTGRHTRSLLTPVLWVAAFLLPLALPRLKLVPAGAPISWRLAALLALSAWCTYALFGLFARDQAWQYFFNALLVAGAAALTWALRPRDFVVLGLTVLALNVLLISGFARLLFEGARGDGVAAALMLTLIAAACVGASGTWLYRLQREEAAA